MRNGIENLEKRLKEVTLEENHELQEATRKIKNTRLLPLGGVIGFAVTRKNFAIADKKGSLADDLLEIYEEAIREE